MKNFLACALTASFSLSTLAADPPLAWPQFRGPNGSGVADDQKPPVNIGPDKNVKWKVAVPSGLSSPIVAGDKLVITAFDNGKLYTIAYDRASGKEAWRAEAPAKQIENFYKAEGSPAASTPVTDGQRIVSYFGSCGLVCYDLAGKELWRFEMPTASAPGDFGTGTSPILADGLVVVVRDEVKNGRIIAVDAATGKPAWETRRRSRRFVLHAGRLGYAGRQTDRRRRARAARRLRPQDGRGKVVADRHAFGLLLLAGRGRGQALFRRLVARRARQRVPDARLRRRARRRRYEQGPEDFPRGIRQDDAQGFLRQHRRQQRRPGHQGRVGRGPQVHDRGQEQRVRAEAGRRPAT